MNSPIEIQQSKFKNALFIIGCLAFLYISFWLMLMPKPPKMTNLFWGAPVFYFIIGLVSALIFGLCAIISFKDFLTKEPGLVISNEGIRDASTAGIVKFIPWQDVLVINELRFISEKFVRIEVKQPQSHYYTKANVIFDFIKKNRLGMKDPHEFLISTNSLACSYKALKTRLENGFEAYKRTIGS
jgi:hypothetical protein